MEVLKRIENGKLVIYNRDGVLYARLAIGPNQYQHRSLKTGNPEQATLTAQKLWAEFTVKRQLGLPVKLRTLNSVIDEYVALRTKQHQQGRTSEHMLRQIHRVVKFWRAYAGSKQVSQIGDAEMSGYVDWRRDYYADMADDELPKNAKRHPTDKTLQWEIMQGKGIIKYAQQQGYRGTVPFPTFSFTPKTKRVRPAFSLVDYRKLWRALIRWERDCDDPRHLHTRQLLRDYVLILANSGLRVGEANNLKLRDINPFKDDHGRRNYRLIVRGKVPTTQLGYPKLLGRKRLILLVRDPRSVVVSHYYHKSVRDGLQVGGLYDFVFSPMHGIERQAAFVEKLLDLYDAKRGDKLLLRYERLHKKPADHFRRFLSFVHPQGIDEGAFEHALKSTQFKAMQQKEIEISKAGATGVARLGTRAWDGDTNSLKTRKADLQEARTVFWPELWQEISKLANTSRLLQRLNYPA